MSVVETHTRTSWCCCLTAVLLCTVTDPSRVTYILGPTGPTLGPTGPWLIVYFRASGLDEVCCVLLGCWDWYILPIKQNPLFKSISFLVWSSSNHGWYPALEVWSYWHSLHDYMMARWTCFSNTWQRLTNQLTLLTNQTPE